MYIYIFLICPVGTGFFRGDGGTDGQADIVKLIVTFHNFANTPKHEILGVFFMWVCVCEQRLFK
jgi:hypothetical protein